MTIEEIKALTEYQKEVFMTKEDGEGISDKLNMIQISIDSMSKDIIEFKH